MTVGVKGTIHCSLDEFYEAICSDDNLKTWMLSIRRRDIVFEKWDVSGGGNSIVDPWNSESYDRSRTITFGYDDRGPAAMYVWSKEDTSKKETTRTINQTIYVKRDGGRKCVISFATAGRSGLGWMGAYSTIHIRWVFTPMDSNTLSVKIGLFVVMKKLHPLAPKLKADASRVGFESQTDLLSHLKDKLATRHAVNVSLEMSQNTKPPEPDCLVCWNR